MPALAPSSDIDLTTSAISSRNKTGIMIFADLSIPFCTPAKIKYAVRNTKKAINPICLGLFVSSALK